MTDKNAPLCAIIAGPNGAGKTTFALHYLPAMLACRNFVNADAVSVENPMIYQQLLEQFDNETG